MMNRLLRQSTLINRCFPILPKILNVGFFYQFFYYNANTRSILPNKETNTPAISFDKTSQFLTVSNHSKNIISSGTKRWVASKTPSPPQTYLRLPKNRKEEIQFLHDFPLAEQSVIQRTLMELMRAVQTENCQFSYEFCGKLRNILIEWLITDKGTWAIARTIKIMHDHGYLKVSVDFHLNIKVLIWIEWNELNEMKDKQYFIFISTLPYLCLNMKQLTLPLPTSREEEVKFLKDLYFAFVSTLPYLPSLNSNKDEQLVVLAAERKQHLEKTDLSNYRLFAFIWCWASKDESIKLSQLCPEVFQHWFNVTLPRIPQWTEKEYNQCIVALGKEGQLAPLEWREEMTKRLLTFKTFDEQQCSNITISIAKLPDLIPNDSDRETLLKKLLNVYYGHVRKNGQTKPQSLSNICWALANLHKSNIIDFKPPKNFWDTAFNAKIVGKFNDESIHQMIYSMFKFGIVPPNN